VACLPNFAERPCSCVELVDNLSAKFYLHSHAKSRVFSAAHPELCNTFRKKILYTKNYV
jgi:hypothetical protein